MNNRDMRSCEGIKWYHSTWSGPYAHELAISVTTNDSPDERRESSDVAINNESAHALIFLPSMKPAEKKKLWNGPPTPADFVDLARKHPPKKTPVE